MSYCWFVLGRCCDFSPHARRIVRRLGIFDEAFVVFARAARRLSFSHLRVNYRRFGI